MPSRAFIQGRIDAAELLIVAHEDASVIAAATGAQSYTLDTGQDRQSVTRYEIGRVNDVISALFLQIQVYEALLNGGSTIARPAF